MKKTPAENRHTSPESTRFPVGAEFAMEYVNDQIANELVTNRNSLL